MWRVWDVFFITLPPFLFFDAKKVGFIHDSVYLCNEDEQICRVSSSSYYINLPFVSIAVVNGINSSGWVFRLYIMQPIGMGLHMAVGYTEALKGHPPYMSAVMGILYKINDNWTPPEDENVTEQVFTTKPNPE